MAAQLDPAAARARKRGLSSPRNAISSTGLTHSCSPPWRPGPPLSQRIAHSSTPLSFFPPRRFFILDGRRESRGPSGGAFRCRHVSLLTETARWSRWFFKRPERVPDTCLTPPRRPASHSARLDGGNRSSLFPRLAPTCCPHDEDCTRESSPSTERSLHCSASRLRTQQGP